MAVEQTTPASLAEFSRCDDRPWLPVGEQNPDHKSDKVDASIAVKVDRVLWNNGVLRNTDYGQIDVDVKDGVVFLNGNVISTTNQQSAEKAVRTIPGVLEVKNYLVSDDKIKREVAGALGKIEHKYGVKFFTGAQHGVIVLNGEVSSQDLRSLAEKCAANIPGVRGVINYVRSPKVDLQTEDQRFIQPLIGERIFFRDGFLGTVQRVIINPDNRRVVSMIVQREISHPQSKLGSLMGGKTLFPEGLVIIPMHIIRYMTMRSGMLQIHSEETAKYSDFDPSFFISPGKDWKPPYPYCPDDVLFPFVSFDDMNQTEIVITEHGISPTLLLGSLPVSISSEGKRELTLTKSKN